MAARNSKLFLDANELPRILSFSLSNLVKAQSIEILNNNVLTSYTFGSLTTLSSLSINNNLLGFTELNVSNNLSYDEFMVDVRVLYKGNEGIQNTPLSIKGFIYPESKKNNFNLLRLNQFLIVNVVQ